VTTTVEFTCNACGTACRVDRLDLGREDPSCPGCRSTVRFRSVLHEVICALGGRGAVLADVEPTNKRGMGLSDWHVMAGGLPRVCDYTNTFFDQEPRLDITAPPDDLLGSLDFLVSSDVFEHVRPPVQDAFDNALRVLRPGGLLILTVPALARGRTIEHFPNLHRFEIVEADEPVLVNHRRDGGIERFGDLVFHGGGGATLEMRVFSIPAVRRHLESAGFVDISLQPDVPEFGVFWQPPPSSVRFRTLALLRRALPLWTWGPTITARRPEGG
jgi:SAM-dependent methyltransferase